MNTSLSNNFFSAGSANLRQGHEFQEVVSLLPRILNLSPRQRQMKLWSWRGERFKSEEEMLLSSDSVFAHVCNGLKDVRE